MTEAPTAAQIAGAVKAVPGSWFNLPSNHPHTVALRRAGLVRGYRHKYADRYSMCLNVEGLAVRAILMEQDRHD